MELLSSFIIGLVLGIIFCWYGGHPQLSCISFYGSFMNLWSSVTFRQVALTGFLAFGLIGIFQVFTVKLIRRMIQKDAVLYEDAGKVLFSCVWFFEKFRRILLVIYFL